MTSIPFISLDDSVCTPISYLDQQRQENKHLQHQASTIDETKEPDHHDSLILHPVQPRKFIIGHKQSNSTNFIVEEEASKAVKYKPKVMPGKLPSAFSNVSK